MIYPVESIIYSSYPMKYIKFIVAPLIICSVCLSSVNAADLAREKRMADEIVDVILDGDAVFLEADNHQFLSIYTEAEESKGVVIILHGRGFHPDWQDTVNPLRVGLTEFGWNTLSVQLPVLEKQAKYYDYVPLFPEALPRIDAAIKFAREQGNEKVVLVAHSCGVHMAMAWIDAWDANGEQKIDAYVGLGMGATDYQQLMEKPFPFEKLTIPILDVYGEHDYPVVLRKAPERLQSIEAAGNKKSSQSVVKGADHYYENKGEELTQVVNRWLQTL
jgi:alpha-beta hydrolase superfamily lysophospholipase